MNFEKFTFRIKTLHLLELSETDIYIYNEIAC